MGHHRHIHSQACVHHDQEKLRSVAIVSEDRQHSHRAHSLTLWPCYPSTFSSSGVRLHGPLSTSVSHGAGLGAQVVTTDPENPLAIQSFSLRSQFSSSADAVHGIGGVQFIDLLTGGTPGYVPGGVTQHMWLLDDTVDHSSVLEPPYSMLRAAATLDLPPTPLQFPMPPPEDVPAFGPPQPDRDRVVVVGAFNPRHTVTWRLWQAQSPAVDAFPPFSPPNDAPWALHAGDAQGSQSAGLVTMFGADGMTVEWTNTIAWDATLSAADSEAHNTTASGAAQQAVVVLALSPAVSPAR